MSALPIRTSGSPTPGEARNDMIWGRPPRELHDALWEAEGVRIVRPGSGPIIWSDGPAFVLLGADDLLSVEPEEMRRLVRRRPNTLHAHLRDRAVRPSDQHTHHERIEADDTGRFIRATRNARSTGLDGGTCIVTGDPIIAILWRHSVDAGAGHRAVRLATGPSGLEHALLPGAVLDVHDTVDREHWGALALERHHTAAATLPSIRPVGPSVLAHATSVVDPHVQFSGAVWIGAGARIDSGHTVIGPGVLPDVIPVGTAVPPLRLVGDDGTPEVVPSPPRVEHRARARRGRRTFDVIFALLALVVTAPLWPLIMLAIWIEDGRPFFFAHTRQTRGGAEFGCLKFRTMCRHADELKHSLADLNTCDGPQFNLRHDPRLLRVGRFLRRFHLDELPQFINVLGGQMSVVGPRPSPEAENRFCPAWRDARLSVRPGVTGLWQVCRTRAPDTDFQEWIRYDLEYVEHRSWRLDGWIILRTIAILAGARSGVQPPRSAVRGE